MQVWGCPSILHEQVTHVSLTPATTASWSFLQFKTVASWDVLSGVNGVLNHVDLVCKWTALYLVLPVSTVLQAQWRGLPLKYGSEKISSPPLPSSRISVGPVCMEGGIAEVHTWYGHMVKGLEKQDWKISDRRFGENYVDGPLRTGTKCDDMVSYANSL